MLINAQVSSSRNTPLIDQVQEAQNEGGVLLGLGETIAYMSFGDGLAPMDDEEVFRHFREKKGKASIGRGRGRRGGGVRGR